jgi:hypothetical protein
LPIDRIYGNMNTQGFYNLKDNTVGLNVNLAGNELLSTIMHELTHKTQYLKGIPTTGENLGHFLPANPLAIQKLGFDKDQLNILLRHIKNNGGISRPSGNIYHNIYRALPEEAQARMVEERLNYPPGRLEMESPIRTLQGMGYPYESLLWGDGPPDPVKNTIK